MTQEGRTKVPYNTAILARLYDNREVPYPLSHPLVDALYLYILVPFRATHMLTVNISIVTFSIPCHRGQVFYHVEAFYAQYCQGLGKKGFMSTIASTAQRAYSIYMSHHVWNLDIADAWSVIPIPVMIFHPSLIASCRRQVQIPEAVLQQDLNCSERSALIVSHLVSTSEASQDVEQILRWSRIRTDTDFCFKQHSFLDEISERTSDSSSAQQVVKHSVNHKEVRSKHALTIHNVAERFLASFRNANFSSIATGLQGLHPSDTDLPENRCSEPAMQAFECCKSTAGQTKEQLKYATFTRFVSLCFFLVWEAIACEPGKSGARTVCALNESQSWCCTINRGLDQCKDERGRVRRNFEGPENAPR